MIQGEEEDKVEFLEYYRDKIEDIEKKIYTNYSYLDGPKGAGYYKKSRINYCPTVMEFEMETGAEPVEESAAEPAEEPAEEPVSIADPQTSRVEDPVETGDPRERGKKIAFPTDSNLAYIQEYEIKNTKNTKKKKKLKKRKTGDERKQKKAKKLLTRYQRDHSNFLIIAEVTEEFNAELLERIKSENRNPANQSNTSFYRKNCKILHDELLSLEPMQKEKIDKIKAYFSEVPSSVVFNGMEDGKARFSIKKQGEEEMVTLRMIDVIDDHILWSILKAFEDDEDDEDDD